MDSAEKIWVCRRSNFDRIISATKVRFVLSLVYQLFLVFSFCRFDVPPDCSVELSHLGYQFFTEIFEIFDKVVTFLVPIFYFILFYSCF